MTLDSLLPWLTPLVAGAIGLYARSLVGPIKQSIDNLRERIRGNELILENRRVAEKEIHEKINDACERLAAVEALVEREKGG